MADFDWGSVIGGAIGAAVTGGAQLFSFRTGRKSARLELASRAESELLEVLLVCDRTLPCLNVTDSAANSPNYHGEISRIAQPMLESIRRADFVLVPQLTNDQLSARFGQFSQLCSEVSGTGVDAEHRAGAVTRVREYGQHVRACIQAELNGTPIPPPVPVPRIGT